MSYLEQTNTRTPRWVGGGGRQEGNIFAKLDFFFFKREIGDGQHDLCGLFRWEGLQCLGVDSATVEQQSLSQVLLEDIRTIRTVVGRKPKKSSLLQEQPRNNYKQSVMISK